MKLSDFVEDDFRKLEAILEEIKDKNDKTLGLLDPRILDTWHRINTHYYNYLKKRNPQSLFVIIPDFIFQEKYKRLKDEFDKLYFTQSLMISCFPTIVSATNRFPICININDTNQFQKYYEEYTINDDKQQ